MAYFTPRSGAGRGRGSLGGVLERTRPTRHLSSFIDPDRPPPFPKPPGRATPTRHNQYLSPPLDPPTHSGRGVGHGSLGSLGTDDPEMTEAQYRTAMLASQREMVSWQERWVKRDELQRWLQFGATLAIPLSAAIWRAIFKSASRGE